MFQNNQIKNYFLGNTINQGTHGRVFQAVNNRQEKFAIKVVQQVEGQKEMVQNNKEKEALLVLHTHPHIVKLYESFYIDRKLYMVLDLCEMNLYQYMLMFKQKKQKIPESAIRNIMYQLIQGLIYIHKHGYIHRDLKPENIMLKQDQRQVKIIDFSTCTKIDLKQKNQQMTDYVCTRWYRSPENILRCGNYDQSIDIWSLGCIMAELYNLVPLFPGQSFIDQLYMYFKVLGTPSKSDWPQGYQLLKKFPDLEFHQFYKQELKDVVPGMCKEGYEILQDMLRFNYLDRAESKNLAIYPYFTKEIYKKDIITR